MRLLMLHNAYARRGGEDEVVERESRLLAGAGVDVRVTIVPNLGLEHPLRAAATAARLPYSRSALRHTRTLLDEVVPDVVHLHNYFPLLTPSVLDACEDACVPVVHTLHNYRYFCSNAVMLRQGRPCESCLHGSVANAVRYACYRESRLASLAVARMIRRHRGRRTWQRKTASFIAPSAFSKGILARAGLPEDRIIVKPHFVDAPAPAPAAGDEGYAVYVGRLSVEKGISSLLEAWSSLDHELRIVGDGPLRDQVQEAASTRRMITYLGPLDRRGVDQVLRSAAFLVFPSVLPETFGMTVIEAYAQGTPVLVSHLGGQAELVREGATGLLFAAGDPLDLAEKATALWSDPGRRREMGAQARAAYEAHYTAERNLELLRAVYDRVVSHGAH